VGFRRRQGAIAGQRAGIRAAADGWRAIGTGLVAGDNYVAYVSAGPQGFNNIYVIWSKGGLRARQVSFLPNYANNSLCWSPHGSFLLFGSGQRTEPYQLARIDLTNRVPLFQEDQFRDLFKEQFPPTKSPSIPTPQPTPKTRPSTGPAPSTLPLPIRGPSINFTDIEQRVSLMPVGMEVADLALSADGKMVAFLAKSGNRRNIYIYPLDSREPVPRQLTSTSGGKLEVQFRNEIVDGKGISRSIYYIQNGEVHSVSLDGTDHAIPVKAEMDVDFDREKLVIFNQAWSALRDHFHDREFHGLNWNEVHDRYAPVIAGAKDPPRSTPLARFDGGRIERVAPGRRLA